MSAEVGGGLIGLVLLASAIGPIIAAALTVLVAGAAVTAAIAVTTAAARGINSLIQKRHQANVSASIERQRTAQTSPGRPNLLAQQLAAQRQQLLNMYQRESQAIDTAAQDLQAQREKLARDARGFSAGQSAQLSAVQQRATQLTQAAEQNVQQHVQTIKVETTRQAAELVRTVNEQLTQRRSDIERRLSTILNTVERDQAAANMANDLWREASSLYEQLRGETDLPDLLPGATALLDKANATVAELMSKRMYQAAIANSVAFAQQVSESYIQLDTLRHRRVLMNEQLNLEAAELRAMVENCAEIKVDKLGKLPTNADYWAGGRLAPLMTQAKQLLADVDKGLTGVSVTKLESLQTDIISCTAQMRRVTAMSRSAYVNAVARIQLVQKAKAAFQATGWQSVSWGFEKGDFLQPLVMRFSHAGGATADLVLKPVYQPATGSYDVEVNVERHDSGLVDEQLRHAQLRQLEQQLKNNGLPVSGLSCKEETKGQNAVGPTMNGRFRVPGEQVRRN